MPTLNVPQAKFLAMPHKFCGFIAGFGSGKTWVGCSGLAQHAWEWPRINAGYFAPTYAQIRDIFYPTMEEVAFDWGLRTRTNQANHEVHLFSGSAYRTTIICRSMEKPQTIVGFKVGRSLVDELDVLSLVKAQQAWRKIIARMRYKVDGLRNRVDVTTTPEGFKFVFQQFVKQLREKPHLQDLYGLVQASTYDNEANLPDDYIDSLMESYPPQLIAAYLRGQFVNLTSGTIYTAYDRTLNASQETVQPGETLFVGMDFNVGKMAAVVHVKRLGLPHAVDEIVNGYDTPDMIRQIKERFWLYADGDYRPTRQIRIYPERLRRLSQVRPGQRDRYRAAQAGRLHRLGARRQPSGQGPDQLHERHVLQRQGRAAVSGQSRPLPDLRRCPRSAGLGHQR